MPENEIIAEIHRRREEVARECGYDARKLIAYYQEREALRADEAHPLVSPAQPSAKETASQLEQAHP